MDIESIFPLCDYFVIASGQSQKQLRTIADEISMLMKQQKVSKLGIEGYQEGNWVLLDFGAIVVHLFLEESRQFYDLELLWGDAPEIGWEPVSVTADSAVQVMSSSEEEESAE